MPTGEVSNRNIKIVYELVVLPNATHRRPVTTLKASGIVSTKYW